MSDTSAPGSGSQPWGIVPDAVRTYSEGNELVVLYLVIAMVLSLLVAGLVLFYVAYPHRGEKPPGVPWLGEAMEKAADAAPVLDEHEMDALRSSR